jgi:general secretion pathway protein D
MSNPDPVRTRAHKSSAVAVVAILPPRLAAVCGLAFCLYVVSTPVAFGQGAAATRQTTRSSSGNYPSSTQVGQASISTDPETRKLVVVTDDKTAEDISRVITTLDRPAPQVLIKVVFVEATYSKGLDIGVTGSYTKNMGNSNTGSVSQAFSGIAGLAGAAAGDGGIYQILGSDFEVTLHALAQAGKTEILSRPSILARNNQMATISLGQRVPIVTGTRFDSLGNQFNTITYENVGIILQVTPFITSDGMVEMIVTPQTSELADRSQWVPTSSGPSGTINSPVINSRSADTVVIVPDRQTVVIGGLMLNQNQQVDSKIPVLGDIPLLGAAFRRRVKNDTKTELLIFLTPQIVNQPSELAAVSANERALSNIPNTVPPRQLDQFLRTTPENNPAQPPTPRD